MDFNDVAVASVKGSDYRIHFWYMSKDDAINIMKNSNLNSNFFMIYKNGWNNLSKKQRHNVK